MYPFILLLLQGNVLVFSASFSEILLMFCFWWEINRKMKQQQQQQKNTLKRHILFCSAQAFLLLMRWHSKLTRAMFCSLHMTLLSLVTLLWVLAGGSELWKRQHHSPTHERSKQGPVSQPGFWGHATLQFFWMLSAPKILAELLKATVSNTSFYFYLFFRNE